MINLILPSQDRKPCSNLHLYFHHKIDGLELQLLFDHFTSSNVEFAYCPISISTKESYS